MIYWGYGIIMRIFNVSLIRKVRKIDWKIFHQMNESRSLLSFQID